MTKVLHPARYTTSLMPVLRDAVESYPRVFDPMAGTGERLYEYIPRAIGIELEPEWAACSPMVFQGNALHLPWTTGYMDAAVCSPCYGNRYSDHHDAKDTCKTCRGTGQEWPGDGTVHGMYPACKKCNGTGLSMRRGYTHDMRATTGDRTRELHPDNAGTLAFGTRAYAELHEAAWREVWRVLGWEGRFVLNVKDHFKTVKGVQVRQHVSAWHLRTCLDIGFQLTKRRRIRTPGMRNGANRDDRLAFETVFIFDLPPAPR